MDRITEIITNPAVSYGSAGFITFLLYYKYSTWKENLRSKLGKIAEEMRAWGFTKIPEALEDLEHANKSGGISKFIQLGEIMADKEERNKLFDETWNNVIDKVLTDKDKKIALIAKIEQHNQDMIDGATPIK